MPKLSKASSLTQPSALLISWKMPIEVNLRPREEKKWNIKYDHDTRVTDQYRVGLEVTATGPDTDIAVSPTPLCAIAHYQGFYWESSTEECKSADPSSISTRNRLVLGHRKGRNRYSTRPLQ
ncbi:hypothetical protein J6590_032592 [Homalodisca vitripennis]|nr:hypothetical protein J6590_032592 [Homalodisca vitripennis]